MIRNSTFPESLRELLAGVKQHSKGWNSPWSGLPNNKVGIDGGRPLPVLSDFCAGFCAEIIRVVPRKITFRLLRSKRREVFLYIDRPLNKVAATASDKNTDRKVEVP